MGLFDFIFYVILVIAGTICFISWVAFRYQAVSLEKENEQLRSDLKKARTKRVKKEYEKVKEVK